MKKRLLSAALALAMVLTLLPLSAMPASAADPEEYWGKTVGYYTAGSTYTGAAANATIPETGWYYLKPATASDPVTPVKVTTGVINSTTTSGTWYTKVDEAMYYGASSVKLIAAVTDASLYLCRNMTIDLNGKEWTVTGGIFVEKTYTSPQGVVTNNGTTKFTITDSSGKRGSFTGDIKVANSTKDVAGGGYNVEVELNNVTTTATVTMNHAGSGKVTVTNAEVGNITMVPIPAAAGGTTTGGTVTVTKTTADTKTGNIAFSKFSDCTFSGGKVEVSGGANTGYISLRSSNGADIDITGYSSTKKIAMTGYGSDLYVANSTVKEIEIFGNSSSLAENLRNSTAPTVTITGQGASVTGEIKKGSGKESLLKPYNINITYNAQVTGPITLDNAAILVNGAGVTGAINLTIGELKLGTAQNTSTMYPTQVGAINLGGENVWYNGQTMTAGAVKMTVEGSNVTTGAIKEAKNNVMGVTVTIPANNSNKFASVESTDKDYSKWTKGTISGGMWQTAVPYDTTVVANQNLLNTNLLYKLEDKRETTYLTSYWQSSQINDLVAKYVDKQTTVETVNKEGGAVGKLTLQVLNPATQPNGNKPGGTGPEDAPGAVKDAKTVFEVTFGSSDTGFQLPSLVGGNSVKQWTATGRSPVNGGGSVSLDGTTEYTYTADSLGYQVSTVNRVEITDRAQNPTATAVLNGTTINLSGAVYALGNVATIDLTLKTDMGDIKVKASWNPNAGTLTFMEGAQSLSTQTNGSMIFADGNTAIQLTANNTKYTLKDAGLRLEASLIDVQGNGGANCSGTEASDFGGMVTTVTIAESIMKKAARDKLAEELTVSAGENGLVDFSKSRAVLEQLGAALAKYDNTQANAWLKSARQQAYRKQTGKDATLDAQLETTGYNTVAAVLYMNVNITSFGSGNTGAGMLTATMTPYLRIEVQHTDGPDSTKNPPIPVVQAVKLGALTGEVGEVTAYLPKSDDITGGFVPAKFITQNNTYVYPGGWSGDRSKPYVTLTHAAANGDGFGTIVINNTDGPITLEDKDGKELEPITRYTTLQAAVDDAKNGEVIKVGSSITGDQTVTMSGDARTIYIDTTGNGIVKCSSNGVIVKEDVNGHNYAVQLTRSTAVEKPKPTTDEVTISVASAANGSASVSASKAKAGDTITVTSTPSSGYNAGGLTIRTDTGATVSYTTTGTNSTTRVTTYTFKVPEGAKTITVTPAFVAINTGVTVTVSNTSYGTATTSAGANKVAPGSTVSVTTAPSTGYRTMGLYVTSNAGTTTATRTGVNSFVFTVPSAATNVVVTPRFDVNNGTVFEDVWSTDYFSSPVAWAVRQGVTDGTSTYRFSPGDSCTRAQMVTFLWRAAGRPSTYGMNNPFYDVTPSMGNDFYNAILWAYANKITDGTSTHYFSPNATVTRAQAVTFLWRYAGKPAASAYSGFYDVPTSEYYAQAVSWAVSKGITNGDGSTVRFNPNGSCLRAQIVTFLYRNATGARA